MGKMEVKETQALLFQSSKESDAGKWLSVGVQEKGGRMKKFHDISRVGEWKWYWTEQKLLLIGLEALGESDNENL